jgi:glucose/mannose-6-phosphate isomerase
MLRGVFGREIKRPITLVRNYHLPAFASKNSLVIVASYSGNTEEPMSCLKEAIRLKAKIVIIAGGGEAIKIAKKHKLPAIIIDTDLNPSNQPRYGLGLQLGAVMGVLSQLKAIKVTYKEIARICERLEMAGSGLVPSADSKTNPAKQLAQALYGKMAFIAGSEHLSGNARVLANQINESAKQLAVPFAIPELNHHLLEAFSYPRKAVDACVFLSLDSALYSRPIKKRFAATEQVFGRLKIECLTLESLSGSKLDSILEILAIGSWTSFYLTMLNGENPAKIPWVDFFKKELNK